jgi:hypothetical protein
MQRWPSSVVYQNDPRPAGCVLCSNGDVLSSDGIAGAALVLPPGGALGRAGRPGRFGVGCEV